MADLDWPGTLAPPMQYSIRPIEHVVKDTSPFTGGTEVMHRYHQWHATMTWNHVTHAQGHALKAHFNRWRGGLNIFEMPIFDYRAKIGSKTGSVTLSGSHTASATSLTITGGSGTFSAGDWIWITENGIRYAYQIVVDETVAVIVIEPGLRSARSGGTTLNHFAAGLIYDTMEFPEGVEAPAIMPSKVPGIFQPFTLEMVTALRG